MRAFVAVNLPSAIRDDLWRAAEPLRAGGFPIRWVRPEGLHLTLKFLGEVDEAHEDRFVTALETAVEGARPFTLALGGFGAFPTPSRPRVVWAGCEAAPALEILQHRVETEMERLGFSVEGRPFRPHVTLGRARREAKAGALRGLERVLEGLVFEAAFSVESVDLMESTLARDGARHAVRRRIELPG